MCSCQCSRSTVSGRVALILSVFALIMATGGIAVAGGQAMLVGENNEATGPTSLVSRSGTALSLKVKRGQPPLKVNSSTLIPNLNADSVDGLDGDSFALRTELPADLSGYTIMVAGSACPSGAQQVGVGGQYGAEDTMAAIFGSFLYRISDFGIGPRISRDREPLRMTACRVR